jgi:hypothetical protein
VTNWNLLKSNKSKDFVFKKIAPIRGRFTLKRIIFLLKIINSKKKNFSLFDHYKDLSKDIIGKYLLKLGTFFFF